jgi:hypothetical protein
MGAACDNPGGHTAWKLFNPFNSIEVFTPADGGSFVCSPFFVNYAGGFTMSASLGGSCGNSPSGRPEDQFVPNTAAFTV